MNIIINEFQVTTDQTRWKFNALLKKYKECNDNNSKSGRSPITFAYFNEMQDMFVIECHRYVIEYVIETILIATM